MQLADDHLRTLIVRGHARISNAISLVDALALDDAAKQGVPAAALPITDRLRASLYNATLPVVNSWLAMSEEVGRPAGRYSFGPYIEHDTYGAPAQFFTIMDTDPDAVKPLLPWTRRDAYPLMMAVRFTSALHGVGGAVVLHTTDDTDKPKVETVEIMHREAVIFPAECWVDAVGEDVILRPAHVEFEPPVKGHQSVLILGA